MTGTLAIMLRHLRRSRLASGLIILWFAWACYLALSSHHSNPHMSLSESLAQLANVCFLVAIFVGSGLRSLSVTSLAFVAPGYRTAEIRAAFAWLAIFSITASLVASLGGAHADLFFAQVVLLQVIGLWPGFLSITGRFFLVSVALAVLYAIMWNHGPLQYLLPWHFALALVLLLLAVWSLYRLLLRVRVAEEFDPGSVRGEVMQMVGLSGKNGRDPGPCAENLGIPAAWLRSYLAVRLRRALHETRSRSEQRRLALGYFGETQDNWLAVAGIVLVAVVSLRWLPGVSIQAMPVVWVGFGGFIWTIGLQWHSGRFFHHRRVLGTLSLWSGSADRATFLSRIANAYLVLALRHGVVIGAMIGVAYYALPINDTVLVERVVAGCLCLLFSDSGITLSLARIRRWPAVALDSLALLARFGVLGVLLLLPASHLWWLTMAALLWLLLARARWRQSEAEFGMFGV